MMDLSLSFEIVLKAVLRIEDLLELMLFYSSDISSSSFKVKICYWSFA